MPGEFSLHGVFVPTLLGLMLLAYVVNSGLHALLQRAHNGLSLNEKIGNASRTGPR